MMDISPVTTTAQTASLAAASDKSVLSSDFETFLQMLTAQARYQDPLEPIDSTEYAAQLAQFSSVEQQVKSNDLLSAIAAELGVGNMAQFAGWIGMDARSAAPAYFDGDAIELTPRPAAAADEAFLIVRNASGEQVLRQPLSLSDQTFAWTGQSDVGGTAASGLYSFSLESRADGDVIRTDTLETYTRVTEARSQEGQTVLVLTGGAQVSSGQVTALRAPS